MSSLSTSLKNSYQKWLHPYEEYLRVVKPGVQQMLEFEHGGPFTPSPAPSPMKKSLQGTPIANPTDSPAIRASFALNATIQGDSAPTPPPELPRPVISSGFTPVNSGGFTAVNTHIAHAPPAQPSTPSSFAAVNLQNGRQHDNIESHTSTPLQNGGSPMISAQNTPDLRPTAIGLTPLSNGQPYNQLKRTLSQDAESSVNEDTDDPSGRRSKRIKKGKLIVKHCLHRIPVLRFRWTCKHELNMRCCARWCGCQLTPCRWRAYRSRFAYDSASPIYPWPKLSSRTCCR